MRRKDSGFLTLLLYADNVLIAGSSMHGIDDLKKELLKTTEMKDLGAADQILGIQIVRN